MSDPLFDRMSFTAKRLPLESRPTRIAVDELHPGPGRMFEGDAIRMIIVADLAERFEIHCRVAEAKQFSSLFHKTEFPYGFGDSINRPLRLESSVMIDPEGCLELLRGDVLKVLCHLSQSYQELFSRYVSVWVQFHHVDPPSAEEFQLYRRISHGDETSTLRRCPEVGLAHFRYGSESSEFQAIADLVKIPGARGDESREENARCPVEKK